MEWVIKILKVGFLTFLGGIVCSGLLFIFSETPSSNELRAVIDWTLIIILMQVCFNLLFVFLLYFTAYFMQNDIKERLFSLKYLLLEILFLYSLYILPIYKITESYWIQILTPFVVLYVLWLLIVMMARNSHRHN
jgi:hypothetical protein